MKNKTFIYLYFFAGLLFLITAGAMYSTENSNLTPVFISLGFAMISIGLVFISRRQKCQSKKTHKES